jgi:hypothetical protein
MKYAVEMDSGAMIHVPKQNKLWGFDPPANYTDRATAASLQS